jgi:hypothetical protein
VLERSSCGQVEGFLELFYKGVGVESVEEIDITRGTTESFEM